MQFYLRNGADQLYMRLLKMSSNNNYCLFYENVLSSSFAQKLHFLHGFVTQLVHLLIIYIQTYSKKSTHVAS